MKKFRRLSRILAAVLLPALLLSSCGKKSSSAGSSSSGASSSASKSSESTAALPENFSLPYYIGQTLDPITCSDGDQQTISSLIYEGMYTLDRSLNPQPCLFTGGSCDAAALVWTFQVRTGVTFSDGTPLRALDCAAALRRAMVSPRYQARFADVRAVSSGSSTVTVSLKKADAGFPALLDIAVVKSGTESQTVPVGTGPYLFTNENGSAALTANAKWWQGRSLPVSRIRLVSCRDLDSLRYQFTSRGVQLIAADLTGKNPVSTSGGVKTYDANTAVMQYLGFNTHKKLFEAPELRRALGLGIDRETVVSAYLSGHGKAAQFPVSPVCDLYPQKMETNYSYHDYLDAMKTLGFTSGTVRSAKLIVNSENPFRVSVANAIASALSSDTDLQISVSALSWEKYTAALKSGDYDLYLGEVRLTADWNLQPLVGTGGALNYGGFSDTQTDTYLTEYAAATDRTAALKSLCSCISQQAPILPVCFKRSSVLTQKGVVSKLTPAVNAPFFNPSAAVINVTSK
jgi:peptide/nickel transport system substrate-binding protein